MPPPPPAPPAPPPPPAAMSVSKKDKQGGGGRTVLLGDIQKGVKLKSSKHLMNDRSEPTVDGKTGGNDKFKTISGPKDHGNRQTTDLENGFATVASHSGSSRNIPNLGDIFAGGLPKLKSTTKNNPSIDNNCERNKIDSMKKTKNERRDDGDDDDDDDVTSSTMINDKNDSTKIMRKYSLPDNTTRNVEKKKPPVPTNKPSFQSMTTCRPSISIFRPGLKPPLPPSKPTLYRSNNSGDCSAGRPVSCVPSFKSNAFPANNSERSVSCIPSSSSQRSPRPVSVFEPSIEGVVVSSSSPRTPRPLSVLEPNGSVLPSSPMSLEPNGNDGEIMMRQSTTAIARALRHSQTFNSTTRPSLPPNPNSKASPPHRNAKVSSPELSTPDLPPQLPKREKRSTKLSPSSRSSVSFDLPLRFSSSSSIESPSSVVIDLQDYSCDSSVVKRGISVDSEFEIQFHFRPEKEFPSPDFFKRSHKMYPSKNPKNPVNVRKSFVMQSIA